LMYSIVWNFNKQVERVTIRREGDRQTDKFFNLRGKNRKER
jgi:hypothetical protein